MDYLWIWASAAAALFQALRYASLKELNRHLSAFVTGYARVLFALPILLVHLVAVLIVKDVPLPAMSATFLLFAGLGAAGQFLGTVLMVRLFQLGNFAVGTMLAKADAVMTAILGTLLFSEVISGAGWLAILVTVAGVLIVSAARFRLMVSAGGAPPGSPALSVFEVLLGPSTRLGLLIALVNAASYLVLREAIVSLKSDGGPAVDAAVAGTAMTVLSCLMIGGWLLITDREGLKGIGRHLGICCFAGFASAFGTLLWFFATALTNASYVAAVAQVQIVFALALSRFWFRETILPWELGGIVVILAGVLMFRIA